MEIIRLDNASAYTLVYLKGEKLIARTTFPSREVEQREFPARYDEEVEDEELGNLYRIYVMIRDKHITREFDVEALRRINWRNAFFEGNRLYHWRGGKLNETKLDIDDSRLRLVEGLGEHLEEIPIHAVLNEDRVEDLRVYVPRNKKAERIFELMAKDELRGDKNVNSILEQEDLDGMHKVALAASLST